MKMMDSSPDDEEQSATPKRDMDLPRHDSAEEMSMEPRDYRTLLEMTRSLVIVKQSSLPLRAPIYRDQAISLETGDCPAELTLRRGEIVRLDKSKLGTTGDEGLATRKEEAEKSSAPEVEDGTGESRSTPPETDSNLRMRIHLGMS